MNIFENNNTKQQSNKEVFRGQEMRKIAYLDKDERELARSLENEEWVSDLSKKEKKQYQEYARYSLNKKSGSISE